MCVRGAADVCHGEKVCPPRNANVCEGVWEFSSEKFRNFSDFLFFGDCFIKMMFSMLFGVENAGVRTFFSPIFENKSISL